MTQNTSEEVEKVQITVARVLEHDDPMVYARLMEMIKE